MSLKKRPVSDLTYFDFGKRVTIYHDDEVHAGILQGISIGADMIETRGMLDPNPSYTPGPIQVTVLVSGWTSPPLALDTDVRVEER